MALTTQERDNIVKLAVGMFNAAPGSTYLQEFTAFFEANGRSLSSLANYFAGSSAYKGIYPNFQSAAEFASTFLTPLGLQANTVATDFVTSRFNKGQSTQSIMLDTLIALDATTDSAFTTAKAILNNKTSVATTYSLTSSALTLSALQAVVSSVDSTAASVTAANTANSSASGNTFTLTTGVDTLTGTSGNDTFTADNSGAAATKQLGAADTITGGAGTDTLRVFNAQADAIDAQSFGTLTSIENIYVNNGTLTTATTLSVANLTGVTSFEVENPLALANGANFTATMGAGQALGLTKVNVVTGGTSTVTMGSASTVTSLTLNTNNAGTDTTNNGTLTVAITGTGVATLNLNGVTAAGKFTLTNAGAALKTVNVTGSVAETVVMAISAVNTINASAATGAQTWDVSGAARQAAFTFTGGTGSDKLTLASGDFATLTAASQLDGGAGTDTLVIKDTTPVYASLNAVKNFEVLGLGVTATTVDASQLTSIKSFTFGALATETINNIGAGSTVTTTGNNTTVTLSAAVGNTAVGLTIGSSTSTGLTVGTLVTTGLTSNTLASLGTAANTITTLTNSDNSTFTVTGSAGLTITNALSGTTTGSKIDGSAMTGILSVVGSTKADILIGGSAADVLSVAATGTANQSDTLTGGAGADSFKFLSATGATFFAMSAGTSAVVKITDFVAATDKFNFVTTGTAFTGATVATAQTIATASTLTAVYAGITAIAASTATNVSAAVITVSAGAAAGTYLYVNDIAGAGVSNTDDMLINITGVSGTITANDFTFA